MNALYTIDAVILCGGQGLRLRPQIGESQKVMAKIHDRPFLDIILAYLQKEGFRRAVLCCGYKSEMIEEYCRRNSSEIDLVVSREETPLGTGGAVKQAERLIGEGPFFVLNGDSFCPLDYCKMLGFHRQKKALATLAVCRKGNSTDYGILTLGDNGRIEEFQEKAARGPGYVNAGVYCLEKGVFDLFPDGEVFSLEKDFFPQLVKDAFFGFEVIEDFIDIGTPERFNEAKKKL